jgi:threonine dehydratase
MPDLDAVFVPVGGGGLIAGVAMYLKFLRPDIHVIGVEPYDSDAMQRSLYEGRRIELDSVGIFADGVAVKLVGEHTFAIARKFVDEVITVSNDEICSAIKSIYEDTRAIVEPAGALGVAGLKKYAKANGLRGKKLVAINSGANMNFDRLQFIAERTQIGGESEALFAVTIPERPGALKRFCGEFIGEKSITEFNYRLMGREAAHIFVGVAIESVAERKRFCAALIASGYECLDLTDNELAKTHIRHMVGGRTDHTSEETLYRFQFPERPRALADFLETMSESWNISLFHYRMHGGDFGRVLIGFEIPPESRAEFLRFLDRANYRYSYESDNPAYKLFL